MKITLELLRSLKACNEGCNWFMDHFPGGEADYQHVLDALAAEDEPGYALWLLENVGPDPIAVMEFDCLLAKNYFAAGSLKIKGDVVVEGNLRVGREIDIGGSIEVGWIIDAGSRIVVGGDIKAGTCILSRSGGIKAGGSIKSGFFIESRGDIEAGNGRGIFAGENERMSKWDLYGKVISTTKPHNLISGEWVKPEELPA